MHRYNIPKYFKYKKEQIYLPLSESINGWDDKTHELMLKDKLRMEAYKAAIVNTIKPGMTVVDIGTGAGILALWALGAGAKIVYGIESNTERCRDAVNRIDDSGLGKKFKIFNNPSYQVNLPERVDIIISEVFGNIADNEDMTPILKDARKRFLKPSGIMLPLQINSYLVPVSSPLMNSQVENLPTGFDSYYDGIVPRNSELSGPEMIQSFNFNSRDKSAYTSKLSFTNSKNSVLTGFKGFFIAQLDSSTVLDISNDNIKSRLTSDSWKHCYFPIKANIKIEAGDQIKVTFKRGYKNNKQYYSWSGTVIRNNKTVGSFKHSTTSIIKT